MGQCLLQGGRAALASVKFDALRARLTRSCSIMIARSPFQCVGFVDVNMEKLFTPSQDLLLNHLPQIRTLPSVQNPLEGGMYCFLEVMSSVDAVRNFNLEIKAEV